VGGAASQLPQFLQHLFSIDKPARFDILLRSRQRSMKGGAVRRIEPVAGIERQEVHLGTLWKRRGFVDEEAAIVDASLESHAERVPLGPRYGSAGESVGAGNRLSRRRNGL
jgi:hypothetical protein